MKLFFIRHGETTGDVENRYGGSYDDHLTLKGIEQAGEFAAFLKDQGIQAVFCSTLIRAMETAEIVAKQVGCPVTPDAGLCERNQYGFLSGMNKDEALQKYPAEVTQLKDRMNTIKDAESYEDFRRRFEVSIEKILKEYEHGTIAVVSHGGPMRALFRHILNWGEIGPIADCAYVELDHQFGTFVSLRSKGISIE